MATVFFFGALICMVCALMLFSSRRLHSGSADGIQCATIAEVLMAIAMLLIALHGVLPPVFTSMLANCLGIAASALIYESTRRMTGAVDQRHRVYGLLAIAIIAQCLLSLLVVTESWRVLLTSLIQGGFVAACLPLLTHRLSSAQPLAVRWGIGFVCLYAVAHTARALITGIVSSAPNDPFMHSTGLVIAGALLIAIAPMIYAMVMIGLINGRVSEDYRRQAEVDVLTGLHTRRSFFQRAGAALANPRPGQEHPTLLMFDLDKFKSVNDLHGHAWGDRVLSEFARIIKNSAPERSLLGRFGGEEFCALIFCESSQEANLAANQMCSSVRSWRGEVGAGPARMTVSAGAAHSPADGRELEALLVVADRRLYMAKTNGRDQVVTHDIVRAEDTLDAFAEVMPI